MTGHSFGRGRICVTYNGTPAAVLSSSKTTIRQVTCKSFVRQAACTYSLIRPPRTVFRRICCGSTSVTVAQGAPRSSSGTRWAMPWCGPAVCCSAPGTRSGRRAARPAAGRLLESEESAHARRLASQDPEKREREHDLRNTSVPLVDCRVQLHGKHDSSPENEEPSQRHDGRANRSVELACAAEPFRKIELTNCMHDRDGQSHEQGSWQQRSRVISDTRQHHRDAEPRQPVDHQGRDKRKPCHAQSQVLADSIHENSDQGHATDQARNSARRAQRSSSPRQRQPPRGC